MKKTTLFTIVLTAVFVLLIMLTPLMFGYNHVYIQECNFDFKSMDYIWTAIGSVTTVIAMFIAIWIPNRIAKKQNDIALFEKRYEVYREFEKLKYFRELLKVEVDPTVNNKTEQGRKNMDCGSFVSYKDISISEVKDLAPGDRFLFLIREAKKTVIKLEEIHLLFATDKKIDDLTGKYTSFVWDMQMTPSKYVTSRKEFLECFDSFGMDDFIAILKTQLKL